MGLKEQWAASRERDRLARLAEERPVRAAMPKPKSKEAGALAPSGAELNALTEEALDEMVAAEQRRQGAMYEEFVRVGTVITFRSLGVQVLAGGDQVYTIGDHQQWTKAKSSRLLGPLEGAEATMTDGVLARL